MRGDPRNDHSDINAERQICLAHGTLQSSTADGKHLRNLELYRTNRETVARSCESLDGYYPSIHLAEATEALGGLVLTTQILLSGARTQCPEFLGLCAIFVMQRKTGASCVQTQHAAFVCHL